jgi:hypothetical protein
MEARNNMHKRFIYVIKTEAGLEDYECGSEASSGFSVHELPDAEFERLSNCGFWGIVNDQCGLMIDDYESEIIKGADLHTCLEMYDGLAIEKGTLYHALSHAAKGGIAVALDF